MKGYKEIAISLLFRKSSPDQDMARVWIRIKSTKIGCGLRCFKKNHVVTSFNWFRKPRVGAGRGGGKGRKEVSFLVSICSIRTHFFSITSNAVLKIYGILNCLLPEMWLRWASCLIVLELIKFFLECLTHTDSLFKLSKILNSAKNWKQMKHSYRT